MGWKLSSNVLHQMLKMLDQKPEDIRFGIEGIYPVAEML